MPVWTETEYADFLLRTGRTPAEAPQKKPKRSKYGAVKTWRDGICFDSVKEADYYEKCKLLHHAGELDGYLYHGKMVCAAGTDKDHRAVLYEPDFILLLPDGTYRIVDTKGVKTDEFRLKEKMLREKVPNVVIEID